MTFKPKPDPQKEGTTIYLTAEQNQQLIAYAEQSGCKKNSLISQMLEFMLLTYYEGEQIEDS
jgi:hypothetical protein